jgi:hypothetical protein
VYKKVVLEYDSFMMKLPPWSDLTPKFYKLHRSMSSHWGFEQTEDGHIWIGLGRWIFTTQP